MAYLRVKVQCFRCNNDFEKTEVRTIKGVTQDPRYQCFPCCKNQREPLLANEKTKRKFDLYCQMCKYNFKSKAMLCPYCAKEDYVIVDDVKLKDLL